MSKWSDQQWSSSKWVLLVSASSYRQAGGVIRFAEWWAEEGFVGIAEGIVSVIFPCVYINVLNVFWWYLRQRCSIELHNHNESSLWVHFFPYCWLCHTVTQSVSACGGIYTTNTTATMITKIPWVARMPNTGPHEKCGSRSGDQKDLMKWTSLWSLQAL